MNNAPKEDSGWWVWAILIVLGLGIGFFQGDKNEGTPASVINSGFIRNDDPRTERSYEEYGDEDCESFSTQEEAQRFFEDEGGPDEDYHNLDRDGDGIVCESL